MIVLQIQVSAGVNGMGLGNIEDSSKGSGGNAFIAGSKHSMQRKVAPGEIAKQLMKFVIVGVFVGRVVVGVDAFARRQ